MYKISDEMHKFIFSICSFLQSTTTFSVSNLNCMFLIINELSLFNV